MDVPGGNGNGTAERRRAFHWQWQIEKEDKREGKYACIHSSARARRPLLL